MLVATRPRCPSFIVGNSSIMLVNWSYHSDFISMKRTSSFQSCAGRLTSSFLSSIGWPASSALSVMDLYKAKVLTDLIHVHPYLTVAIHSTIRPPWFANVLLADLTPF